MSSSPLSLRPAGPSDAHPLTRLAQLDSVRPLTGRVLVAERDGRLLAALSLDDGRVAADPFQFTAEPVALLRLRAAQLRPSARRRNVLRPALGH